MCHSLDNNDTSTQRFTYSMEGISFCSGYGWLGRKGTDCLTVILSADIINHGGN